ncbi:MAG: DNA polymerase/3'-5' exonuclease PolX [Ignavibacteria bacterium]|nr:DNA polymerase/3'-5' exonuclease PolX [Ignavibacteria bacterium]MBI3765478.1 DNA polymerase/3'-5' exonuclease PolX [Ignavibacteriales bacterium]
MTNKQIAEILEEIGTLLELQGDNPFKCRAYHNAGRIIGALTTDVHELIKSNELQTIKGIGQGLAEKLIELDSTGKLKFYDDLKQSVPPGLLEMLRIPGLGPKRIKIVYDRLKIKTVSGLKKAAEEHKLASVSGFGKKTEENILNGIELLQKHTDQHLYSEAKLAADRILEVIRNQRCVIRCDIAGSLRRRKEVIGDIDILASIKKGSERTLMKVFTTHPDVEQIIAQGETKSSVLLNSGINCDLRVIDDIEYPFALAYFTGNKEHNVAMRSLAKKYGWSLNEYGFSELGAEEKRGKAKRIVSCKTEEDVYGALKLAYVPPELRENMGELEAAHEGHIPNLVSEEDLRGTFHCHTTYSDGSNTLLEMVGAARDLGWEYLGIADHSKVAAYAGGLTETRLKQQHKEIDALNAKLRGFTIFKGTEVDILADGSLDWSDKVLSTFDYVVASVHSKFKMTEAEATKRIIKALKNKYVTMLGHPTGRLLLQREGYPVNMVEVINAAADYSKIIEINSHPFRLDLDWRLCKFAKEKGVKVSINPDAHNINGLRDVHYGVGIARKGWLEKRDVINTRTFKEITLLLDHTS